MRVRISSELLDAIRAEAAASPGLEVCGLLLGSDERVQPGDDAPSPFALSLSKGGLRAECSSPVLRQAQHERGEEADARIAIGCTIEEARPCRNVAADPARRFEIDPAALLAAHRQGRAGGPAILGCYHSHPSGSAEPSARDAAAAEPNGWLWLIVGRNELFGWRAVENGSTLGRFERCQIL